MTQSDERSDSLTQGEAESGAIRDADLIPATPDETAMLLAILRASVATILTTRKDFRIKITPKQRERAYGVVVRAAMTTDETIHLWLEPADERMRLGVPYLGPNAPGRPTPTTSRIRSGREGAESEWLRTSPLLSGRLST